MIAAPDYALFPLRKKKGCINGGVAKDDRDRKTPAKYSEHWALPCPARESRWTAQARHRLERGMNGAIS